ncbi:PalH-domain-containing protein [Delitschia confertaspora ATCC 74209]|uniref:PalH-domain-containing protein n=1 Tax=Delitschia confertaspora ATCC 74209 TaxID=1513339 RepID=A0A9P4JGY6_9PLEO|nr:PalH-domain-containing protein [Delitschia confertaspora ATCC 74209]
MARLARMEEGGGVRRAQDVTTAQPTTTTKPYSDGCAPFTLPSAGVIALNSEYTVTLTAGAVFTPVCTTMSTLSGDFDLEDNDMSCITSIAHQRDPFHASITPQAYATGAATVIAWMLVIMLIIAPRTFFIGGVGGRAGLMGRRGMIGGASGGGSIIGVGTRPWLQKAAALTVAISLTLATADTFKIAERQYAEGYSDATKLRKDVVGGREIKVSRVISDVFLWLAQVQTLIRLFPRHKEKVIIKWVGFALILLDIVFACLNNFGHYKGPRGPGHFNTAIPALSYLFQLSLSMLYAAWVIYYAITKRRYAFYHPMMWNITIVALLSFVAILTPVVFFITDISNDSVAGWGDYFRWVGAAAASVIVWEWVERIEALEREERKDGILGREIYDGDEMLEATPYTEVNNWPRQQRDGPETDLGNFGSGSGGGGGGGGGGLTTSRSNGHGFSSLAHRLGRSRFRRQTWQEYEPPTDLVRPPIAHRRSNDQRNPRNARDDYSQIPIPPEPVASPVSRTDTTSADSTVYTIRYHPISNSPPVVRQSATRDERLRRANSSNGGQRRDPEKVPEENAERPQNRTNWAWQFVTNPFKRRRASPPPEVQRGRVIEPLGVEDVSANIPAHNYSRWALKDRLGAFAAEQGEKIREKTSGGRQAESNLPVTIIPAQPRGRTWSPEILLAQQQRSQSHSGTESESGSRGCSQKSASDAGGSTQACVHPRGQSSVQQSNTVDPTSAFSRSSPSRIRFTPETFQRPGARQSDSENRTPVRTPITMDLGTEQPRTPSGVESSVQEGSELEKEGGPKQPTNHDR